LYRKGWRLIFFRFLPAGKEILLDQVIMSTWSWRVVDHPLGTLVLLPEEVDDMRRAK